MTDAAHNQHSETRRPSDRDRIVTTGPSRFQPARPEVLPEMMSVSVAGIQKNRCRTTIAERMVETRAELAFTGDQTGLFRAQPGRPTLSALQFGAIHPHEFFPMHVLPKSFHRIRHYGLFANANRANNIAMARRLLAVPDPTPSSRASDHAENGRVDEDWNACPCCGGRMIIVEAFEPGCQPRFWPVPSIGLDSS